MARTPNEIAQLIRHREDRGGTQKIPKKGKKFNPNIDKRNSNKNKLKESYGSESV
jgi:hypothetical protein